MKPRFTVGERHGQLVVDRLEYVHVTTGGKKKPMVMCTCDCGKRYVGSLYDLKSGRTKSCGCVRRQVRRTHGATSNSIHTPEYKAWRNMLTRGRNPNIKAADRYVLRGITVCDEWCPGGDGKGFERFLGHVGLKPTRHHSLDRIDNEKGYEPGNVRWATKREQVNNQCRNFWLTVNNERMPLQDAAQRYGIKASIILQRIRKLGWSHERAVSVPPRPDRRRAA